MKEQWKPLLETEIEKIYTKGKWNLIVGKKEFTLQDDKIILKRKRMKEQEPKSENKLPRCANCHQISTFNRRKEFNCFKKD